MSTSSLMKPQGTRKLPLGLTALSLSYFMVLLDSTILNVALPTIEKDLHGSVTSLQWAVNSYTLIFASFLLSGGTLGDRYGAHRIFRLGLVLFTGTSLLCSLAPNINVLIATRVLQGLGAALMIPSSLSLIAHLYTTLQDRAKAVAIWAGIGSIAVACGPTLGGLLIESFGWRGVFLVNLPFGIFSLVLAYISIPATSQRQESSLDLPGQFLAILACCALTYGLIEWGYLAPPLLIATFVLAILSGVAFLGIEAHSKSPMLPLALFRSWRVVATMLVALAFQFSFYSLIFVLSFFFQQFYGYQALATGLAFLPQTLVGSSMMLFATQWIARQLRPGISLAAGMLMGAGGMVVILVGIHVGFAMIALGEALVGITASFVVAPMTTVVLTSITKEYSGVASACLNASRQMGGVLGVAILGTILGNQPVFLATQMALCIMLSVFLLGFVLILTSEGQRNGK